MSRMTNFNDLRIEFGSVWSWRVIPLPHTEIQRAILPPVRWVFTAHWNDQAVTPTSAMWHWKMRETCFRNVSPLRAAARHCNLPHFTKTLILKDLVRWFLVNSRNERFQRSPCQHLVKVVVGWVSVWAGLLRVTRGRVVVLACYGWLSLTTTLHDTCCEGLSLLILVNHVAMFRPAARARRMPNVVTQHCNFTLQHITLRYTRQE
jgi:hypothetical protein